MKWSGGIYRSADRQVLETVQVLGPWFDSREKAEQATRRYLRLAQEDRIDLAGYLISQGPPREVTDMPCGKVRSPGLRKQLHIRQTYIRRALQAHGEQQDQAIADELDRVIGALVMAAETEGPFSVTIQGASVDFDPARLAAKLENQKKNPSRREILAGLAEAWAIFGCLLEGGGQAAQRATNEPDEAKAFDLAAKIIDKLPPDVSRPEIIAAVISASKEKAGTVKAIVRALFPRPPKPEPTEEDIEVREKKKRARVVKGLSPVWDRLSIESRAMLETWAQTGEVPRLAEIKEKEPPPAVEPTKGPEPEPPEPSAPEIIPSRFYIVAVWDTTNGVLQHQWSDPSDRREKSWIATVTRDRSKPGGLDRLFWPKARADFYRVPELERGRILEWGYDRHKSSGKTERRRRYATVLDIAEQSLVTTDPEREIEGAETAYKNANEIPPWGRVRSALAAKIGKKTLADIKATTESLAAAQAEPEAAKIRAYFYSFSGLGNRLVRALEAQDFNGALDLFASVEMEFPSFDQIHKVLYASLAEAAGFKPKAAPEPTPIVTPPPSPESTPKEPPQPVWLLRLLVTAGTRHERLIDVATVRVATKRKAQHAFKRMFPEFKLQFRFVGTETPWATVHGDQKVIEQPVPEIGRERIKEAIAWLRQFDDSKDQDIRLGPAILDPAESPTGPKPGYRLPPRDEFLGSMTVPEGNEYRIHMTDQEVVEKFLYEFCAKIRERSPESVKKALKTARVDWSGQGETNPKVQLISYTDRGMALILDELKNMAPWEVWGTSVVRYMETQASVEFDRAKVIRGTRDFFGILQADGPTPPDEDPALRALLQAIEARLTPELIEKTKAQLIT